MADPSILLAELYASLRLVYTQDLFESSPSLLKLSV